MHVISRDVASRVSNFKIPAGSITIVVFISTATFIALLDRFLFPTWQTLTGRTLTPLERIGTGHVFNILSTVISALVESERLKTVHDNRQGVVPMLALWLFPQLSLVGVGEAFHLPGNILLYYQEFPDSMKSTPTSMTSIVIGIAFYFSTALVDLIRNVTGWLPVDVNNGRLDNVHWALVVLGLILVIFCCALSFTNIVFLRRKWKLIPGFDLNKEVGDRVLCHAVQGWSSPLQWKQRRLGHCLWQIFQSVLP